MPAHHGLGRDDRQVLAPAGTPSARQDPEQLVPGAKTGPRSGASGTGQDGELMAQEEVFEIG